MDQAERRFREVQSRATDTNWPTAAKYPELFLHVDAAWGGVFLALPECRKESFLDEINARAAVQAEDGAICAGGEVHSFCTNLHKYVDGSRCGTSRGLIVESAGAVSSPSTRVASGPYIPLKFEGLLQAGTSANLSRSPPGSATVLS